MNPFTPSRLTLARRRRGLTKTELAEHAQVTARIVTEWEAGRRTPTENNLGRVAAALQFPVSFFSQGDLEVPDPGAVSFRSLASMTAAQRDAALGAGALAYALSAWIEERFDLPQVNLPDMRGMAPEDAARAMRERWAIGLHPVRSMVHLMEANGVRVFSLAEKCLEMDAFSSWNGGKPFCFLNTMKTAEHSRFDCAHELGHLVLHRHGAPSDRTAEREADAFASAFLMPTETVRAYVPEMATMRTLIQLKSNWAVSVAALAHRSHKLGKLTDRHYRGICIDISRRGRANEPNPIPNRETSQVLQKVFAALREDGVSKADVAASLHVFQKDIDELVFGLVLTAVEAMESRPASVYVPPPAPPPRPFFPPLRLVKPS